MHVCVYVYYVMYVGYGLCVCYVCALCVHVCDACCLGAF